MTQKMKKQSLPSQYDPDFKVALKVLERAANRARETALRSKTPLALWKNGRVTTVMPKAKVKSRGK